MICNVCGQEYGLAHNCSGVAATMTPEESAPFPTGFAPLYYLRLAFNIVRWDEVSIRRASRDPMALVYGVCIWAITAWLILYYTALPQMLGAMRLRGPEAIIGLIFGFVVATFVMAVITFVQLALCHLIAKWFFDGKGTLLGVLRPLLLAWYVNALTPLPIAGAISAIAWIAVLMLVFEEVEGIGRLQAFLISAGVNVCFFLLQLGFLAKR